MKNLVCKATVVASLFLSAGVHGQATSKGCYKNVEPPLEDQGPDRYQSQGKCTKTCTALKMPVMALYARSNCLCGKELPPEDEKTDDDDCSATCQGFGEETCGGMEAYGVFLTGLDTKPPVYGGDKSSSSSSSSASATDASTSTATATATSEPSTDDEGGGGGVNKGAVAAGVVVGVLAVAGIIGGAWFFLKYRKRKEVVEEYRRNATISSFVAGGGKPTSKSSAGDSRLEPNMMSQRRQSNGSIGDEQDFSRRILQVTNPDSQH